MYFKCDLILLLNKFLKIKQVFMCFDCALSDLSIIFFVMCHILHILFLNFRF